MLLSCFPRLLTFGMAHLEVTVKIYSYMFVFYQCNQIIKGVMHKN